jgi:hypothetical protein
MAQLVTMTNLEIATTAKVTLTTAITYQQQSVISNGELDVSTANYNIIIVITGQIMEAFLRHVVTVLFLTEAVRS